MLCDYACCALLYAWSCVSCDFSAIRTLFLCFIMVKVTSRSYFGIYNRKFRRCNFFFKYLKTSCQCFQFCCLDAIPLSISPLLLGFEKDSSLLYKNVEFEAENRTSVRLILLEMQFRVVSCQFCVCRLLQ